MVPHILVPCQGSASQCGLEGLSVILLLDALSKRLWTRRAFSVALQQRRTLQALFGISCREGVVQCMTSQSSPGHCCCDVSGRMAALSGRVAVPRPGRAQCAEQLCGTLTAGEPADR